MTALCLVFDLDDTLYPERDYVRSGFRAVGAWIEQEFRKPGFYERALVDFEGGRRGDIFNRALEALGIEYDEKRVQNLVEVYRSHIPEIELFGDVEAFLTTYSAAVPFCLITDGYSIAQKNKVAALGIESHFRSIIYTDEFGRDYWKPHPKAFQAVETSVADADTAFVYIGDNENKDFIAPKSLGWNTVKIERDCGEYKQAEVAVENRAHHTISSLSELPQLLSL